MVQKRGVAFQYKKKDKKKEKPKSKDPRPKQSDIDKGVYKNYNEYRQAVLAWKKRNEPPKKKREYVSPYERKHGKKQKNSNDLKIKNTSTAKDRVGKVNLNSPEYKEAKRINEQPVKYQTEKKKTSGVGPVKDGDTYAKNLKKTTQGIGPVKDGKTYAKNATKYRQITQEELEKIAEGKKEKKSEGSGKKESKFIRNPKTKTLVRRTSQKGKQLLKIKSRIDSRNKKLFGDKKKKKKKK